MNKFLIVKNTCKIGALLAAGLCLSTASAASWTGSTGNWTDDSWGLSGDYPGSGTQSGAQALIEGSDDVVTLNTALPNGLGFTRLNNGAILNLETGGSLSVNGGQTVNFRKSTVNVNGGTFTANHTVEFGRNLGANSVQLNVSTGTFDVKGTGGGGLFRLDGSTGGGAISVSGTGTFQALDGRAFAHNDLQTFTMNLSGSATFDLVGASSSSTWDMAGNTGISGLSHTFSLNGSDVTAEAGGMNAYATDADHEAVFNFTADGSGFSTFNIGTLTLNGGNHAADLIVDLNGLTSGNFEIPPKK